jgi:hypothetical protein
MLVCPKLKLRDLRRHPCPLAFIEVTTLQVQCFMPPQTPIPDLPLLSQPVHYLSQGDLHEINEHRMRARWRLGQMLAKVERQQGPGPGRGKKEKGGTGRTPF